MKYCLLHGILFILFIGALLVDLIPFFGQPAWTIIVFLQIRYNLDIWLTLVFGLAGSALGRYIYSLYISLISDRFLKKQKAEDLKFIGEKLKGKYWKVKLFVVLYTSLPIPSIRLFTAAEISKIKTKYIMPAFFLGKFFIDGFMVYTENYIGGNAQEMISRMVTWKSFIRYFFQVFYLWLFFYV